MHCKSILTAFCIALTVLCLGACSGPIGPIPGGALQGQSADLGGDWAFAQAEDQIQLETKNADGTEHSVNIWCGVVDGRLYLPTSLVRGAESPQERQWVQNALRDSHARVRIAGKIYPGQIRHVKETELASRVKEALLKKYDASPDARSADAWIFEIANP